MDLSNELTQEEDRYDKWAVRRIMDGKGCYVHKNLMCIPIHDKDCKTCYQKEVSKV